MQRGVGWLPGHALLRRIHLGKDLFHCRVNQPSQFSDHSILCWNAVLARSHVNQERIARVPAADVRGLRPPVRRR